MKPFLRFSFIALIFVTLAFAQGPQTTTTIAVPDSIAAEGVPEMPAALADKVARYSEFRSASFEDWNPTKRQMLIGTRFADTNQVHTVAMPGGARTQLTFFPDRSGGARYQPVKGKYFIFNKDIGGGEWYQLFRYDLVTGDVTLLTDGKSRNTSMIWDHTGDRIAYSSTRRDGKDSDIYIQDPMDPASARMLLQVESGGWSPSDFSHDGKWLLVHEGISVNDSHIWLVNIASGEKKMVSLKSESKVAYSGPRFTPDDKSFYATTDSDSEFNRLAHFDLAGGKPKILTADTPWDVEEFALSADGQTIAYAVNENGNSTLHFMDAMTSKAITFSKVPAGIISGLRWHANGKEIAFGLSNARSPSDVYSVNLSAATVTRWTHSETGGLNTANFSEPELIKWKTFDGKEITGWLYKPPANFAGKRPVIVNIHGGPEGQSRPTFIARNNYYVNDLGIAMIFPNVRGSLGYGKSFADSDNGFKREDTYKDIDALLDWIKASATLDGDRIMVTGGSYGGHMTLAVATNYNDKIRCSVDVVGISNLRTFLEHTEEYRRDLRRVEYGDEREPKMREFMERTAPLNKFQNVTKPMMIVAGKNDPRVPKSEADQMVAKLREKNTPVWYIVGKNEGHGFSKKINQDYQFYATIAFVEEYLLK